MERFKQGTESSMMDLQVYTLIWNMARTH